MTGCTICILISLSLSLSYSRATILCPNLSTLSQHWLSESTNISIVCSRFRPPLPPCSFTMGTTCTQRWRKNKPRAESLNRQSKPCISVFRLSISFSFVVSYLNVFDVPGLNYVNPSDVSTRASSSFLCFPIHPSFKIVCSWDNISFSIREPTQKHQRKVLSTRRATLLQHLDIKQRTIRCDGLGPSSSSSSSSSLGTWCVRHWPYSAWLFLNLAKQQPTPHLHPTLPGMQQLQSDCRLLQARMVIVFDRCKAEDMYGPHLPTVKEHECIHCMCRRTAKEHTTHQTQRFKCKNEFIMRYGTALLVFPTKWREKSKKERKRKEKKKEARCERLVHTG